MAPPLSKLDRATSLADQLAERLRQAIVGGQLAAGARLPTEAQMASQYALSRPTVREAVGRLRHDGLIVTRQGSGAFVADAQDVSSFRLDQPDMTDHTALQSLIEFLMPFEARATALAAERRSEAELAAIHGHLAGMRLAFVEGRSGVDDDIGFHQTIMRASGNTLFQDFSRFIDARVRNFIRTARANTARLSAEAAEAVQAEHERIYAAIACRNRTDAETAAEDHLRNASARLSHMLSNSGKLRNP